MFTVYCAGHGHQVLLFSDNITALVNHPDGIDLHWRCTCGETGIEPRRHNGNGTGTGARQRHAA